MTPPRLRDTLVETLGIPPKITIRSKKVTKKKELTLQDIFTQNNELYKNIIDCLQNIEAKIDELQIEDNTVKSIEVHDGVMLTDKDYITITADDVVVGGESVREYNGEEIYNYYHLPAYFKEIRDNVAEKGIKLLEIHCLQSSTDGEYAEKGNPTPDKNGCSAWCRCVWKKDGKKHIGAWVFNRTTDSAALCARYCADFCAYYVRDLAGFRAAVFGDAD